MLCLYAIVQFQDQLDYKVINLQISSLSSVGMNMWLVLVLYVSSDLHTVSHKWNNERILQEVYSRSKFVFTLYVMSWFRINNHKCLFIHFLQFIIIFTWVLICRLQNIVNFGPVLHPLWTFVWVFVTYFSIFNSCAHGPTVPCLFTGIGRVLTCWWGSIKGTRHWDSSC